ncbi:MAG: DHHW family protein, partial [Candidatus Nanoarchaeia archaeon]|nr:DHHW family protein [Candidatus Nanoarchaeia archaeon]
RVKIFGNRTNLLIEYLKTNTNITLIDLRKPLIEKKDSYKLYYTNEHHWTYIGAYFGYLEVIKKLKITKNLEFYNISEFKVSDITKKGGTAGMIGMEKTLLDKEKYYSLSEYQKNVTSTEMGPLIRVKTVTSSNNSSKPNIFIFGDSFLNYFEPFISPLGNNVTYLINSYNEVNEFEMMKKQNLSIIIYERNEHNLFKFFHNTNFTDI